MQKKSEEFKEIIRNRMEEFLKPQGFAEIGLADNRSRGLAFLRFYLYDIFSVFNSDIDEDNIESSIVDKENDLGIDFIYIDDSQVFIIQSKYVGSKSKINTSDIDKLINIPINIKNSDFVKNANDELKQILLTLKGVKNPTFNLIFLTSDFIPQDKINNYFALIPKSNVTFQLLDISHLKQEYKRVESLNSLPPNEIKLDLGNEDYFELKNLEQTDEAYPTSIITLKGTKIQQLYQQYGEALFNYNIRLWLGEKNVVNKSMIDTIKTEPSRFIYYNNGVTAVCEEFYPIEEGKSKKLICKNFQIINGAQTITTIAKQNSANLSTIKVLVRIVAGETGKKTHSATGLNENIVKNTNSQSVINPADFRSNDLIQVSIEHQARNLNYSLTSPIKPIFYQRKRRKEKPKGTKVITMQELGKSYYSFKYNPYELNASTRRLWDTSSNGLYYYVFGVDGESTDTVNIDTLYDMFGAHLLYEYVKLKVKELDKKSNPVILFKYHIIWGISILLKLKYNKAEIHNILVDMVKTGKYINPKVNPEIEHRFSIVYERAIRCINSCINRIQRDEKVFVIRNYQRKKDFVDDIKTEIETIIIPETDIPNLI